MLRSGDDQRRRGGTGRTECGFERLEVTDMIDGTPCTAENRPQDECIHRVVLGKQDGANVRRRDHRRRLLPQHRSVVVDRVAFSPFL